MRAIFADDAGHLEFRTVPDPVPGPSQVVLDVEAAGVNRADLLQAAGHYPPPPGAPDWLGLECAGTITAIGNQVSHWHLGQGACALVPGGAYAEKVLVDVELLLPIPRGLATADAAALPEAACTAWSNLVDVAHLAPGDWVLIHGGSGGVGSLAIQIARALGARVLTTAGGPERAARCQELGALAAIDHRTEDFVARSAQITGGHGLDVILDVIGAAYLDRNLQALALGGRLVVIGRQRGSRAELDLGTLLAKRASIAGTTLRSRPAAERAAIVAAVRQRVWPLVADGSIRPVIDQRIPMAQAGQAHQLLAKGQAFGKVLLTR